MAEVKFSKELKFFGGCFRGVDNFPQDRFSMVEFYVGETFNWDIGWGDGKNFHGGRISGIIWKLLKIKEKEKFFFKRK